jgi:hypothetical protein
VINFCIKCFKGHLCLQYHNKKGFGLKCDTCHFRVGILEGAARVVKEDGAEGKCPECDASMITATYKAGDKTPFPGNKREHTGCILCDTIMRGTLVNFFARKREKKAFEDMNEEEKKVYEEVRKKKEEKKKKKEDEAKKSGADASSKPAGAG